MDREPFSHRELWKIVAPGWLVEHVLGPFPDEVGWGLFSLKWAAVGGFLSVLIDVSLVVPISLVLTGLLGIIFATMFPWDE